MSQRPVLLFYTPRLVTTERTVGFIQMRVGGEMRGAIDPHKTRESYTDMGAPGGVPKGEGFLTEGEDSTSDPIPHLGYEHVSLSLSNALGEKRLKADRASCSQVTGKTTGPFLELFWVGAMFPQFTFSKLINISRRGGMTMLGNTTFLCTTTCILKGGPQHWALLVERQWAKALCSRNGLVLG